MWETILELELSNATLCAGGDRGRDSWKGWVVVMALALLFCLYFRGSGEI